MYATLQDMLDRFGADEVTVLTDRATPATGEVDEAVLDRALRTAAAEIDAALAARYRTPVEPPVPALLTDIACDLARFALYTTHVTDAVAERAKAARAQLRMLSDGRMLLPLPAAPTPGTQAVDGADLAVTPVPMFGTAQMRGF